MAFDVQYFTIGELMEALLSLLFKLAAGAAAGLALFIIKSFHKRLTHIENNMDKLMTEDQVRMLLNDKLEPLKDRMVILELKLDKIIDLLLRIKE
jgi:hypothetical protein